MSLAALYIRVSSAEQVHGYSLDVQERACREYAERQGWSVAEVYREEGESAKTADRPGLQRMLVEVCAKGSGVDFVVVYDLSRLARDTFDHLAIQRQLETHGIRLRAATQNLEDSAEGKFVQTVLSATNELENALRRRKVLAGMQEAVRRGRWVWAAPLGYRWRGGEERKRTLELDPDVAPHLRWAFEAAARGLHSAPEILSALADRGLRVPRATLYRAFRNPLYAGRIVVPEWGVDTTGSHEPLVDFATFRAASRGTSARRSYSTGESAAFPFRQITRCGGCGRGIAGYFAKGKGKGTGRWPYYRCQACRVSVAARRLEDQFASLLDGLSATPRQLDALAEVLRDVQGRREATRRERATVAVRALAAERQRLAKLTEAFVYREALPEAEYRRMRTEHEQRVSTLEQEASLALGPAVDFEPAWRVARELLQTPLVAWDLLLESSRPAFLRGLFPAGLTWEPAGQFRTPEKCLMRLSFQPPEECSGSGGTPVEPDFEVVDAWLAALFNLGRMVPGASLRA